MQRIRRSLSLASALLTLALSGAALAAESVRVTMYRSPSCGCCEKWADHLESAGFSVEIRDSLDMASVKAAQGVPASLASRAT